MPRKKQRVPPLDSDNELNARFFSAWEAGVEREVFLTFKDKSTLLKMRAKLQNFRTECKKQNWPGWQKLYKATTKIDPNNPCTLIICPDASQDILDTFTSANITPKEKPAKKTTSTSNDLDDFFSDLGDL